MSQTVTLKGNPIRVDGDLPATGTLAGTVRMCGARTLFTDGRDVPPTRCRTE